MAASYGANAVYQGYIGKFYQQRGIDGAALPWLLAAFPLMSVPAQLLWGRLSDRTGRRAAVLRGVILLSALILPFYTIQRGFPGMLAVSCAFAVCYPAIQPLGDSVILKSLQVQDKPYGPVRLAGCAAFSLSSLAAGRLLRDDYGSVPLAACAGLLLTLAVSFLMPAGGEKVKSRSQPSIFQVLRLPHMLPMLSLFMVLQMTLGYFYSYYALLFTSLPGGSSRLLGWSLFAASVSEAPFLLLGDRLFNRFGAGRLMLLSALSMAVRYLLLGLGRGLVPVFAGQLLHGLGFVVMTFSMAKYISLIAPEELLSGGQTLLSAAGFGIARVLGSLLGRWVELQTGFLIMAAAAGATFAFFLPVFRGLPPLNGKG